LQNSIIILETTSTKFYLFLPLCIQGLWTKDDFYSFQHFFKSFSFSLTSLIIETWWKWIFFLSSVHETKTARREKKLQKLFFVKNKRLKQISWSHITQRKLRLFVFLHFLIVFWVFSIKVCKKISLFFDNRIINDFILNLPT
jgi:hypothetical protein